MNAPNLPGLLDEWRLLTLQEATAISNQNWPLTACLQNTKAQLCGRIDGVLKTGEIPHRNLVPVVSELARLEADNLKRLNLQLAANTSKRAELDGSASNLRRLRSSYTAQPSALWQSYS
jgi:hypothetical protein